MSISHIIYGTFLVNELNHKYIVLTEQEAREILDLLVDYGKLDKEYFKKLLEE